MRSDGVTAIKNDRSVLLCGYGIRLKRKTLHALFALDIPLFSDVVPNPLQADLLDGTFLCFYFTDRNGRVSKKSVPRGMEKEILSLIVPYARRLKGK